MSAPNLLFLATEDWFVRSHFLPLLRRAKAEGFDVAVAARLSGALSEPGVRLIDMPFARGSLSLGDISGEIGAVRALLRRETPAIVHAIALKPIALSLLAGANGAARVFALTGRGYLGARKSWWTGLSLHLISRLLRRAAAQERSMLLVENEADLRWVEAGAPLPANRAVLMPGAGVDIETLKPAPEPAEPIVVGVASRLIWSKGVDLAIAAISRLRAQGLDIELRIAGAADPANRERVSESEIAAWRSTPGVSVLGQVGDITAFWAGAHIACAPSRGGEGLPRSLIEAGACGRPLVTTDTPGCADFVRAGACGLVVAPGDADAVAQALATLAADANQRRSMGAAARAHVVAGYTEAHAAACAARAWRRLLSRGS